MIHAGAAAGVYELKDMAFETMECFLRAGASCARFRRFRVPLTLCRRDARSLLLYSRLPRLARRVGERHESKRETSSLSTRRKDFGALPRSPIHLLARLHLALSQPSVILHLSIPFLLLSGFR